MASSTSSKPLTRTLMSGISGPISLEPFHTQDSQTVSTSNAAPVAEPINSTDATYKSFAEWRKAGAEKSTQTLQTEADPKE